MSGLTEDHTHTPFPTSRLIELTPSIDARNVARGHPLLPRPAQIQVAGQTIALRLHRGVTTLLFICPRCSSGRWRLYECDGLWLCRVCHGLDYSSRHIHRTVPNYARLQFLRRRLGVVRSPAKRKRMRAQIKRLERGLVKHLAGVNRDLRRRAKLRGMVDHGKGTGTHR